MQESSLWILCLGVLLLHACCAGRRKCLTLGHSQLPKICNISKPCLVYMLFFCGRQAHPVSVVGRKLSHPPLEGVLLMLAALTRGNTSAQLLAFDVALSSLSPDTHDVPCPPCLVVRCGRELMRELPCTTAQCLELRRVGA